MDKILNLGCADKLIPGAINVDILPWPGVDVNVDLGKPWPWADQSIDGIYARHIIEHFADQEFFIQECYRVLKRGGFLDIFVPHSSSITSVGCWGHYRTFCYDTLEDYLTKDTYVFKGIKFKTISKRLCWWYSETNWDNVHPSLRYIIPPVDFIMTQLIMLSPKLFENLWCYWVGGAREVKWKGIKV